MALNNPKPNKFQIEDESAIQEDIRTFRAPKVGDEVNVVMPDGTEFTGKILTGRVMEVRGEGRVIDATFHPDPNKSEGFTLKDVTYCSAERLKLKCRPKTWHWPAKAKAKE
jgi:hypothetical protein